MIATMEVCLLRIGSWVVQKRARVVYFDGSMIDSVSWGWITAPCNYLKRVMKLKGFLHVGNVKVEHLAC